MARTHVAYQKSTGKNSKTTMLYKASRQPTLMKFMVIVISYF